jgi:hypothetical protein
MAAFKPLTEEQVTFTWELEADDLDPADMMCGDPAYEAEDKARIVEIRDRLQRGDERAWCWVRVTATDADGNEGSDSLGGIELGTDAGWGDQLEAHVRETFPDIWSEALASLNEARRAKHTPKVVRMCKTEASRDRNGNTWVRARHVTTNKMKRQPWDVALDEYENHATVAEAVLGGRPQFSASIDGGGYMFGLDPATVKP